MHDALSHGQSEPLFLTDEEISAITGLALRSLKSYRLKDGLPYGTRQPFLCTTYTGATRRISRNFTDAALIRAWLVKVGRNHCLSALDKLIADKLATFPEVAGE